jgi:hypothetical protein
VRIQAQSIVLDGKITAAANGTTTQNNPGGAGGSIRIDTSTISGAGEVHADGGGSAFLGGGGGRIAIYYSGSTGLALNRAFITAFGGGGSSPPTRFGNAGTVYVRQVDSSGVKVMDELIIDNGTGSSSNITPLVDLGSGTVTAVSGNTLTLSGAVPAWVNGSLIEILDAVGTVIGSYEIASSTSTTVTVIVPTGQTLNAPIGSAYRGSTKIATVTVGTNSKLQTAALRGDDMTLSGEIDTTEIRARNLTLRHASVRQTATTATTTNALRVIATGALSVDSTSVIDATGRGFLVGRTWNNTTSGASATAGGSHGGSGGIDINNGASVAAAVYGSLFDPNEPGAGGSTQNSGLTGGGVVRIQAQSIVLDGKITTSGNGTTQNNPGGAGGSIRIDTSTISGAGEVHADGGGSAFLGGGGGRIAIYYSSSTGFALNRALITTVGGSGTTPVTRFGAAGTIYLRQVDTAGLKVADELIVDNGTTSFNNTFTPLVDLGTGTVTAVSGSTLTLSGAVPNWVAGSSIEIMDALGNVIAKYEIASSTATTVTVIVPSGQTLNAPIGSAYRGSMGIATVTVGANAKLQGAAFRGDDMTLSGEIDTTEIRARNLTLKHALVRQTPTTATTINALRIFASGTLSVDSSSVIDAAGRGFLVGRTWNNTTSGASVTGGGSHGGTGGHDINDPASVAAAVYGSLFDPNEPGAGGSTQNSGLSGGGIVRVQAQSIVLDGKITASGNGTTQNNPSGAGGSIRIDTSTISGAGEVHADGGASAYMDGGGGRVAIYYSGSAGLALNRALITTVGGSGGSPITRLGTAGTIYLRQVDSAGLKVTDELIVDNGTNAFNSFTPLVDLGTGTVTAVSGSVLTLSGAVPNWVARSSIEILDALGSVIAKYEIASSTATTVTVIVPSGQTLNAPTGSGYRGSMGIATVTVGANAKLQAAAFRGDDMTLSGEIDTTEIAARNLTLKHALVRQTATTATITNALRIVATGVLSIDSSSVIDATGRGFLAGRTWNNSTMGASVAGAGSHGGLGGLDTGSPSGFVAVPYGSLYNPNEPGGGGATSGTSGQTGGGVVRIAAQSIMLDGKITALGIGSTTQNVASGAGGSVRIDATTISGIGEVHADGGPSLYLGGGGGRVAIYYTGNTGLGLNRTLITAAGGSGGSPSSRVGAAGTIYLKRDTQPNGELIVDNGTNVTPQSTVLTPVGGGLITSVTSSIGGASDTIGDANAAFPIPNLLSGNRVYINGDKSLLWPVSGNTATALTFNVAANALNATVGQTYNGLYRFDTLKLRNAKLSSADEIESLTAVDQDAASSTTITSTPATAPSLSSLTAQPQSVTGGGTITLAIRMAARSQSTFVGLASTSAALPVPGSIIIPANALTASFTVTTANPAAAANVTVTATAGTSSVSTTVTVIPSPATLTSITLASQSVQGGTSVNATIVLGAAAPAGGASVAVSASNGSLATVPSVVVVPEGAATVAFTIGTAQTAASTAVTITGIYGSTQSATLTITPCSAMSSVSAPASAPLTTVWLDDALPSGATTSGVGGLATTQSASGTQSIAIPAASGSRQFAFTGGAALAVASGDKLVAYLLINPCNPPRQVMLVFSDATTDYRASWGEDLIEPTIAHTRFGTMPAGGTWLRLEMLAATIGAAGKNLTGLAIKVYDGEAWIDRIGIQTCTLSTAPPPASFSAVESVWFDDQLPAGAVPNPSVWSFDTTQRASGANSHKEPLGTGYRQHYFTGATNTMLVKPGDVLFTYVLVDPCNPPRQIQLQWFEGTNWNKANWGDPIGASFGTALNYQIGPIPDGGNWVRLEVPAQLVGLENKTVTGADFGITDGQAWFDRVGKFSRVDVAIGGTATQSSTFDSTTTADKAVDGKTDGVSGNGSISITTQQAQAWWQVDLGTSKAIDSVEVWNRTDCCANRLTGFWLFVSDSSFASTDVTTTLNQAGVSSYRYDGLPGTNVLFAVNRTGRYVRIQLMGTEFLQLAEVQVWAPGTAQRVNAAGGRSTATTQSSTSSGWVADRAVNGTTLPNSSDASLTSTNSEANAWWQIDLGSSQFVSSIDLFNRNDSSPQRLERFYVLASDNPFASSVLTDTLAQAGVSVIYTGIPASGRPAPASYSIPINRTARYVRVQLTTTDVLTLAEVQIWPLLQQLAPLDVAPGPRAAAIRAFDFKTAYRSRGAR